MGQQKPVLADKELRRQKVHTFWRKLAQTLDPPGDFSRLLVLIEELHDRVLALIAGDQVKFCQGKRDPFAVGIADRG